MILKMLIFLAWLTAMCDKISQWKMQYPLLLDKCLSKTMVFLCNLVSRYFDRHGDYMEGIDAANIHVRSRHH